MGECIIGMDVSKDALDVFRLEDGVHARFANSAGGHLELIGWTGAASREGLAVRVVYEPTGSFHLGVEEALARSGVDLVKVNPLMARRFAEATGRLAKTDRLDAAMLARMAAALRLEPRGVPDESLRAVKELLVARTALIKDRTAARNRQARVVQPLLKRQAQERLEHIGRQLAEVDAAIRAAVKADAALSARHAILTSIPGIGSITACVLLGEMPELGGLEHKEAASLAGLAPMARQSGRWKGQARIRGGRGQVRHALYMPALVAARINPALRDLYQRLIKAGKPAKVAITAVMRKLLVFANARLQKGQPWAEKPA